MGADAPYSRPPGASPALAAPLDGAAIDGFARIGREAYPALRIRGLRLPGAPGRPIGFLGQVDALLVRDRTNGVWVYPDDGACCGWRRARS